MNIFETKSVFFQGSIEHSRVLGENASIVIQIYDKKKSFGLYFEIKSLFLVCFLTTIWSVFGLYFRVFSLGKELVAVHNSPG